MEKKCWRCGETKDISLFHRNKRNKDGRTTECSVCRKAMGAAYAKANRVKLNEMQLNRANERIALGLCRHCKEKAVGNVGLCEKHWMQDRSRKHFGTTKRWEELKALAVKQDYRCVYTDEKLVPGENMSLDHITSRFDDPALTEDIGNLQWVTKDINVVKNKYSHDAFVALCGVIYKRYTVGRTDGNQRVSDMKLCSQALQGTKSAARAVGIPGIHAGEDVNGGERES